MERQRAFLEKGPKSLALTSLGNVVKELKMRENALRYLLKNNSIRTPHGVFPLEHFVRFPIVRVRPTAS
jgi:RNA polymerase sigma-54 factor